MNVSPDGENIFATGGKSLSWLFPGSLYLIPGIEVRKYRLQSRSKLYSKKKHESTDHKYVVKSDSRPVNEKVLKDTDSCLGLPLRVFTGKRHLLLRVF